MGRISWFLLHITCEYRKLYIYNTTSKIPWESVQCGRSSVRMLSSNVPPLSSFKIALNALPLINSSVRATRSRLRLLSFCSACRQDAVEEYDRASIGCFFSLFEKRKIPIFLSCLQTSVRSGKRCLMEWRREERKEKERMQGKGEPMHCIYIVFSLWYISMLSGSTLRFLMTFMCKQRKFLLPPSICRRHRLMTFCYLPGHRVSPDHPQLGITQQRGSIAISGLQWCVGQVCTWTAVRAHV